MSILTFSSIIEVIASSTIPFYRSSYRSFTSTLSVFLTIIVLFSSCSILKLAILIWSACTRMSLVW